MSSDGASKRRWKEAISLVVKTLQLGTWQRHFRIEALFELKKVFLDPSGGLRELNFTDFCRSFSDNPEIGVRLTERQLRHWFDAIDVDVSDSVSWEEFTSYMIHLSTESKVDEDRSKEFVSSSFAVDARNEHKDVVKRLVINEAEGLAITGGFDGMLKGWSCALGNHVRTVNNSKFSVSRIARQAGFAAGVIPITDVVLGSHNTVCYVSAVDKSIHLYDSSTLDLQRRYVGRNKLNDLGVPAEFLGGSKAPVETVALMELNDTVMSFDVGTISEREHFFLGLGDGSVMSYPIMRHSSVSEIRPAWKVKAHSSSVAKLRLIGDDELCTCGWDRQLTLISVKLGHVRIRLNGGDSALNGHHKAAFDFAYSRRNKLIGSIACEREIYLWTTNSESPVAKLEGHGSLLCSLAFNESDHQLISLSTDNVIKIWDLRNFRLVQSIKHNDRYSKLGQIAYDHRTQTIIGAANVPYSWCMRRALTNFPAGQGGHAEPLIGLGLAQTHSLVSTDPYTTIVWDLRTGAQMRSFRSRHEASVGTAAALDTPGRRVIVANQNGQLGFFNVTNGQLIREFLLRCKEPAVQLVHVAATPEVKRVLVLTPAELIFVSEPQFKQVTVHCRWSAFVAVVRGPSSSTQVAFVATTDGTIVAVNPTAATISNVFTQYSWGLTKNLLATEAAVLIPDTSILCVAGNSLRFVEYRQEFRVLGSLRNPGDDTITQLCCWKRFLAAADEGGWVTIWQLPRSSPDMLCERNVVQIWRFRCSEKPIARLVTGSKGPYFVFGALDYRIGLVAFSGEFVGYFGQTEPWRLRRRSSWAQSCPQESPLSYPRRSVFETAIPQELDGSSPATPSNAVLNSTPEHDSPALPLHHEPRAMVGVRRSTPLVNLQRALTPSLRPGNKRNLVLRSEPRPPIVNEALVEPDLPRVSEAREIFIPLATESYSRPNSVLELYRSRPVNDVTLGDLMLPPLRPKPVERHPADTTHDRVSKAKRTEPRGWTSRASSLLPLRELQRSVEIPKLSFGM
jgi:WD40 repeat protein